jgi:CheY-like chemotaxis protein
MSKILVIDDEKDYRGVVLIALQNAGYETLEAADGESGIKLARNHKPDMILCDLMMPGISGYETLAAIRSDPSTAKIPFVFLTAFDEPFSKMRGSELGMNGFLQKPVALQQLLETIQITLREAKL